MIIFQLTTSRRGRPTLMSFAENAYTNFNSLPHAEVDGKLALNPIVFEPFQLTTSRRGRLSLYFLWFRFEEYFNSLPHAEVDEVLRLLLNRPAYFNSLPHAEVDPHFEILGK